MQQKNLKLELLKYRSLLKCYINSRNFIHNHTWTSQYTMCDYFLRACGEYECVGGFCATVVAQKTSLTLTKNARKRALDKSVN